jgi:dTDP-4-dehydrorhamnose reductase
MNIAVVGSSGYIGRNIVDRVSKVSGIDNVLSISRGGTPDVVLDLTNSEKFDYNLLNAIDYVVFTAACLQDKCTSDFETSWAINVTGTMHFISEAIKRDCRVIFFSSDAVFGEIPGKIYTELSETVPVTAYGKMKKAVEDEFKGNALFKVIRPSYVVSADDRFVSYCRSCIENGVTADIYHPYYRNCVVISDVVDAVLWFIFHWNEYEYFALNVADRELISKVRIADELNLFLKNKLKYKILTSEDEFFKNRSAVIRMKSLFLHEYGIVKNDTFSEKISREFSTIKAMRGEKNGD